MKRIQCVIRLVLVASVLTFACSHQLSVATAQTTPLSTVRFGSVGGLTDAPLYIAEDLGYFAESGLKVERQPMTNAPTLMTAIATGQLDVGGIAVTAGLFAAIDRDIHLRIVGDKQSLRPGFSATRAVIRADLAKDTEEANVRTLKDKTIAVSDKAGTHHMLLQKLLFKYGMSLSDVKIVQLALSSMVPALNTKAIDAAFLLEPFLSQAVHSGAVKVVSDLTEFAPQEGGILVPMVYSEQFSENRKAADAFMVAYMRGVRIYNDAFVKDENKDKIIDIIARGAKLDRQVVRNAFPAGFDPNQRVSIPFLNEFQRFFVEQKYLDRTVDVSRLVDMSFADSAVKLLGRAK